MNDAQDHNATMTAALANVMGALIDAGATWTDDITDYGGKIRHEIERRDLEIQLLEFQLASCGRAAERILGKNDMIAPVFATRVYFDIVEMRARLDAYLHADGKIDEQNKPICADSESFGGLESDDDQFCDDCCAPEGQCGEDCPQHVPRPKVSGPAYENTDNAPPSLVLAALRQCAASWEGGVRLLGNIRAQDIVRAIDELGVTPRVPNTALHPDPFEAPDKTKP